MTINRQYDHKFKFMMLGDAGVGKTSIARCGSFPFFNKKNPLNLKRIIRNRTVFRTKTSFFLVQIFMMFEFGRKTIAAFNFKKICFAIIILFHVIINESSI